MLASIDTTRSEVVGYYVVGNEEFTVDWCDNYQIIQCQGCKAISFRHVGWFSEYLDEESDGTSEQLYPKRSANTLPIKSFLNVPPNLRRIYREAIDSYNYECYTMCAAALRAIVEGLCADQKVIDGPVFVKKKDGSETVKRKKDLQAKIAGLYEKGILTKINADLLHEHRYLGNEAVHELTQPSINELLLAIEIAEHMFDTLYEIPDKAEQLRKAKLLRAGKT
jgi:hypothetical protein